MQSLLPLHRSSYHRVDTIAAVATIAAAATGAAAGTIVAAATSLPSQQAPIQEAAVEKQQETSATKQRQQVVPMAAAMRCGGRRQHVQY